MERRQNLFDMVRAMPLAHQVTIGIAVAVLAMAGYLFFQWVSTPTYAVLYTNLEDGALSEVVDELERQGVPYEIEAGGSRVLVPRGDVYRIRGNLAASGVRTGNAPEGYELLDGQGLNVSDFRQRVDYQRALEGELERTLLAMTDITSATVHLVIPEEALFIEDEEPVTASVLIGSAGPLGPSEVETVTFLVSSAVEALEASMVTVADIDGEILHAGGELAAGGGAIGNRNLRMTREYEAAVAADLRALLSTVAGPNTPSVIVRAQLSFDEESVETETYDKDTAVPVRQQTREETFVGAGDPPGGTVGVEGDEIETEDGEVYDYRLFEETTEYGIDRTLIRSVTAPGKIEQISVAVVMDDGSLTGMTVPPTSEIESLVTAAAGLVAARGDTVSVSTIPFPVEVEGELTEAEAAGGDLDIMSLIPQVIGGIVLFIVAFAFLIMSRSKKVDLSDGAAVAGAANGGALPGAPAAGLPAGADELGAVGSEIMQMVHRQPEEVAVLLRSWLADRR